MVPLTYGGIESGHKGQRKGLLGLTFLKESAKKWVISSLLFSKKVPPRIHNQTLSQTPMVCVLFPQASCCSCCSLFVEHLGTKRNTLS
jgi:hypothetical protein